MANYHRRTNWTKTIKGFSDALGYAGEHLTGWARGWMAEAVREAIDLIDADWEGGATITRIKWGKNNVQRRHFGGDHDHPWYTGQLHDSIAGIVSDQHRIIAIDYMHRAASKPQTYEGQIIIGHDWGIRKAQEMQRVLHFLPGIRATIVVGVPYGDKVNEMPRHADYKSELSNQFASNVEDYFTIKAGGYRTRVFRTK